MAFSNIVNAEHGLNDTHQNSELCPDEPLRNLDFVRCTRSGARFHTLFQEEKPRKRVAVNYGHIPEGKLSERMPRNMTTVIYGHIPDVPSGVIARSRNELKKLLVHTAISMHYCIRNEGVASILLDDKLHFTDEGTHVILHGYKDGNLQYLQRNECLHKGFISNVKSGKPIRVIRSHDSNSPHRPYRGYRYDGLYSVKLISYNGLNNYCLSRIKSPNEETPRELISSSQSVRATLLQAKSLQNKQNEPNNIKKEELETHEYYNMLQYLKTETPEDENLEQYNISENPSFDNNNETVKTEYDYENPETNIRCKVEPDLETGDDRYYNEHCQHSDSDSGVDTTEIAKRNIEHRNRTDCSEPMGKEILCNKTARITKTNENISMPINESGCSSHLKNNNKQPPCKSSHRCLYTLTIAEFLELTSTAESNNNCPCSFNERRITESDLNCLLSYIEKFNPKAKSAFRCLVNDFRKRIRTAPLNKSDLNRCKGFSRGKTASPHPAKLCKKCMAKFLLKHVDPRKGTYCRKKEHPLLSKGAPIVPEEEEEDADFLGFG